MADNDKTQEFKVLRDRIEALEALAKNNDLEKFDDRLSMVEDSVPDKNINTRWNDLSKAGTAPDIAQAPKHDLPIREEVLGVDIEFGKPTANVTADSATVTLQPCDEDGNSFASASTVTVYVGMDRTSQAIASAGWTTSTVLSFFRFSPWVSGTPNIEGVLTGRHSGLPTTIGETTWTVLQVDDSTPKKPIWGPVRAIA